MCLRVWDCVSVFARDGKTANIINSWMMYVLLGCMFNSWQTLHGKWEANEREVVARLLFARKCNHLLPRWEMKKEQPGRQRGDWQLCRETFASSSYPAPDWVAMKRQTRWQAHTEKHREKRQKTGSHPSKFTSLLILCLHRAHRTQPSAIARERNSAAFPLFGELGRSVVLSQIG